MHSKRSFWDEVLIYQFDRTKKFLFIIFLFLGPLLNLFAYWLKYKDIVSSVDFALLGSVHQLLSILSVPIYMIYVFISLHTVSSVLSKIHKFMKGSHSHFSFLGDWFRWSFAFFLASCLQYQFYYLPVMNYQYPKNPELMAVTTLLYGLVAAVVCYYFRLSLKLAETK